MVITKIFGGLGNQMFQYAVGKAVAIRKNDILKLDIDNFKNDSFGRVYKLHNFYIKDEIATNYEIKRLKGYDGIFRKVFNKLGLEIKRSSSYYNERNLMCFDEGVFCKYGDIYLDGFWQNEKYFKNIREELLKIFIPKNISDTAQKFLEQIQNGESVSIHIRRKDYLSLKHIYYICELDYYKKAIELMKSKVMNPKFFVFSDDIDWCKKNLGIQAIYIENTIDIDDLFLMKNCKHNIIANSTFSWWGAWLNENENKMVIGPKQWFVKKEWKNLNLICERWIKI